jgi:biopolymer transport protein ExbD
MLLAIIISLSVTTSFTRIAPVDIKLPTAEDDMNFPQRNAVEIIIDYKGRYFIDGNELVDSKPETLFQALSQVIETRSELTPPLTIRADADSSYQSVITVLDIAGRLGLKDFSMQTPKHK